MERIIIILFLITILSVLLTGIFVLNTKMKTLQNSTSSTVSVNTDIKSDTTVANKALYTTYHDNVDDETKGLSLDDTYDDMEDEGNEEW